MSVAVDIVSGRLTVTQWSLPTHSPRLRQIGPRQPVWMLMQLKRSEGAQPSGRPSRLENIPDMITMRLGWLETQLLHPYGCLAVGWSGGKDSQDVSRYVSQHTRPSFWSKTIRERPPIVLAHNKISLRILLHSTIDGIDSEWVISVATWSFTRAHTHYPATRQSSN